MDWATSRGMWHDVDGVYARGREKDVGRRDRRTCMSFQSHTEAKMQKPGQPAEQASRVSLTDPWRFQKRKQRHAIAIADYASFFFFSVLAFVLIVDSSEGASARERWNDDIRREQEVKGQGLQR